MRAQFKWVCARPSGCGRLPEYKKLEPGLWKDKLTNSLAPGDAKVHEGDTVKRQVIGKVAGLRVDLGSGRLYSSALSYETNP